MTPTMRAAVTRGPLDVAVEEVALEAGHDDVLVRVEAVGLCGTDLHVFDGSFPGARYPIVQGHELSAVVQHLPDDHDGRLRVGDRVAVEPIRPCGDCLACRRGRPNACARLHAIGVTRPGGLADLLAVPAWACHPTPGLGPVAAALCEPVSVAAHAVARGQVTAEDRVLVLGAGPIGLATTVAVRDVGAQVMAVDLQPSRLELAARLGSVATAAPDDLREVLADFAPDGPTVVFEATGVPGVATNAFELAAPTGTVVLVGVSRSDVSVSLRLFTARELTVVGSRGTPDFAAAVDLVGRHAADLELLVTHRLPLEQVRDAFTQAMDHPEETVKVVVEVG